MSRKQLSPFGYDVDINGMLVKNEKEQRAIVLIDQLRSKGYSLRAIAGTLKAKRFTD